MMNLKKIDFQKEKGIMKEKKMPWWKILLIIVFLPVEIVYYVIKFRSF